MAKLAKCEDSKNLIGENYPTWLVIDDNVGSMDLGTIYFDGDGMVFDPLTKSGAHHTADHLREIADQMDTLESIVTGAFERQLT